MSNNRSAFKGSNMFHGGNEYNPQGNGNGNGNVNGNANMFNHKGNFTIQRESDISSASAFTKKQSSSRNPK
jgi:hypothetical protein